MGRIKTKLVKRVSRQLIAQTTDSFTSKFDDNKKALGRTMPSKRLRNMMAGYITRIKRNTKTILPSDK
jgi:ribosomal protein S17E